MVAASRFPLAGDLLLKTGSGFDHLNLTLISPQHLDRSLQHSHLPTELVCNSRKSESFSEDSQKFAPAVLTDRFIVSNQKEDAAP